MLSKLFLGLDVGTQGTKAILYNADTHEVVGRGSSNYDIIATSVVGRAEQHPEVWLQGIRAATKEALRDADGSCVCGVGVSGQQHGLVVLDERGQVLRPAKLWCDTESAAEAEELSQRLGRTLVPSFTVTKLLWLKRNEPEVFERVAHVLLPHDYVNWWLTGRHVMEYGDASGTGLFDSAGQAWDVSAMELVDERLRSTIPDLVGPNQVIGTVLPSVAAELGLGAVAVSPGSGDNACAALGVGVISSGQMVVSLGTSGTIFGKSDVPVIDPTGAICPFCDATGAWLPLLCTLNCTRVLEEVKEAFGLSHEELTALAEAEAGPGCSGVTLLPYMIGERTPCWPHASGAILGLRPGCLRPGLLYRAAMEGATLSLLAGLRRITTLAPQLVPKELRLVGGGSKNRLWRQVVADAFQMPVVLPAEAESAALGAALQAAACCSGVAVSEYIQQHPPPLLGEVIHPNPQHQAAYEEALARHVQLGEQLFATHVPH